MNEGDEPAKNLPIAIAVYGPTNALASLTLMALSRDVRRLGVRPESAEDYDHNVGSWINLAVFMLCIPGGICWVRTARTSWSCWPFPDEWPSSVG